MKRSIVLWAVAMAPLLGAGEGTASQGFDGLAVRKAKVRLNRDRTEPGDRIRLRASFRGQDAQSEFDPGNQTLDLFLNGREVLCVPGTIIFDPGEGQPGPGPEPAPVPVPGDPPPVGGPPPIWQPPGDGNVGEPGEGEYRVWTLENRGWRRWLYRTEGRRVLLDLEKGEVDVISGDLDLGSLVTDGPKNVRVSLRLGAHCIETSVRFKARKRAWRLSR